MAFTSTVYEQLLMTTPNQEELLTLCQSSIIFQQKGCNKPSWEKHTQRSEHEAWCSCTYKHHTIPKPPHLEETINGHHFTTKYVFSTVPYCPQTKGKTQTNKPTDNIGESERRVWKGNTLHKCVCVYISIYIYTYKYT